tara:strand:+ start:1738 stop:2127 length:390 start_codon:yes stop_codon:yes gene_type:complete
MINKTNINKVLNKLPKDKVELEKVELAKVSDLVKLSDKIKKTGDSVETDIDKVISSLDGKIRGKIKSVLGDIEKAEKMSDEIIKATKELGVDVPSDAKAAISQIDAYRSSLQNSDSQVVKSINGLLGAF